MSTTRHIRRTLLAVLVVAILVGAGSAYAQSGYPHRVDPYVNDFASLLTGEHAASLRSLFSELKSDNGVEIVAVTVDSIHDYATGDASIEAFATNLFNTWGLGETQKNDGVLILVAWKDREVRIEVGSGYGRSLDADLQTIINEQMIPSFRREDYSQGIYDGAQAVSRRLYAYSGKTPAAVETATQAPSGSVNILPFMIVFVVGVAASAVGAEQYARYHRRRCPNCQTYLQRLDEVADDVLLDSGQKVEELLQSVDYDVWKCPTCNYHTLQCYNRWMSGFGQCPQCNYRTLSTKSDTISLPSYTSSGTKLISQDCRHCKYHDEERITLPMLTLPEERETDDTDSIRHSSSRSTWSSNHSSSTRSSSSSRSSSHSSGGGRSSGGGASGKW